MTADSRVPDIGKLGLALLEHGFEPLLGEKAIQVLRSPSDETQLRESLATVLKNTERRFVTEHNDSEVCEAILSLPLTDPPSLKNALRDFYARPTDAAFAEILLSRLTADFTSLSKERVDAAISSYITILREELVPLSNEIRDKLSTLAALGTERNTARIADAVEHISAALYNPSEVSIVKAPSPPKSVKREPKRVLVYELGPHTSIDEVRADWKFLSSSATIVGVSNGVFDIGSIEGQTCSFPQIDPLENCSVECDLRILEVGKNNDTSLWAGIRLRGFVYDFGLGYLAYLRRTGTIELYRAYQVIGGANEPIVADTENSWTKIRVDVFKSRMRVRVNGNLHINVMDKKFCDMGLVFLHTYFTHAQFRNLRIFKLK